jgi:hypothetical protein
MFLSILYIVDDRNIKKDWQIIDGFHNDRLETFKLFDDYPSHLHIDLLDKAQGKHMVIDNV